MENQEFDIIGTIVDPRDLDDEEWQEVIVIATEYIKKGEHVYKSAVLAYFDYVAEDEKTTQH